MPGGADGENPNAGLVQASDGPVFRLSLRRLPEHRLLPR